MPAMLASVVLLCVLPLGVVGFGNGAGGGACPGQIPGHGTVQQTAAPYMLEVSVDHLEANKDIKVTIKKKDASQADDIGGFLVQARCTNCSDHDRDNKIIDGKFTADDANSKPKTCSATDDSITHTNPNAKTSVSFMWKPPANLDLKKGVIFRATVAKEKLTWWTRIESKKLLMKSGVSPIIPSAITILAASLLALF